MEEHRYTDEQGRNTATTISDGEMVETPDLVDPSQPADEDTHEQVVRYGDPADDTAQAGTTQADTPDTPYDSAPAVDTPAPEDGLPNDQQVVTPDPVTGEVANQTDQGVPLDSEGQSITAPGSDGEPDADGGGVATSTETPDWPDDQPTDVSPDPAP